MKYKVFDSFIWDQIHKTLDVVLQQDLHPVAAFDADGTLWDTDLGESFFSYLIEKKLVPLPTDPWEHYQAMKMDPGGPQKAYLWLAQILKGIPFTQVQEWSQSSLQHEGPLPYFSDQKKLIELLISKKVSVYIVTASVKWAVEPGAQFLGLSPEQVLGVETEIQDGKITERQKGVITYREGKTEALLKVTGGKKPFLSSGNTMGDWQLLEAATHLRLAVSASPADSRLFRTEQELYRAAKQRSWLTHRFR